MVILHPVYPVAQVAGEDDAEQLEHPEAEDGSRDVAKVVHEDVLHGGEAALGVEVRAVLGAGA